MTFLKQIDFHGFKSFANHTKIVFADKIVGLVGPNGSGKSNIIDALKWALGEQSHRSLRSQSTAEVLFAGSSKYEARNIAEVTLHINNDHDIIATEYKNLELKRRYDRISNENQYFINKKRVLMKDVSRLALEMKLGRNSLALISQGQVDKISDMNAEDRRLFLDNALGISRYKYQRNEALRNLKQSEVNIAKLQVLKEQLQKTVPLLKKQKDKASAFQTHKTRIAKIELQILLHDMTQAHDTFSEDEKSLNNLKNQIIALDNEILKDTATFNGVNDENSLIDDELLLFNNKVAALYEEINKLEAEQKRETSQQKALPTAGKALAEQQTLQNNYQTLQQDITYKQAMLAETASKLEAENKKINTLVQQITDLTTLKKQLTDQTNQLALENKILATRLENATLSKSVQLIMQNSHNFKGIIGLVKDLITYDAKYEKALSAVLGARMTNIVTNDAYTAQKIINFLKTNQAGRLSLLPLNNLKPRYLVDEEIFLAEKTLGFVAFGPDVVQFKKTHQDLVFYLLGQIIISSDYDKGLHLSHLLKQRHDVVTLDGEVFKARGAIVGGSVKRPDVKHFQQTMAANLNKQQRLFDKINQLEQKSNLLNYQKDHLHLNQEALNNQLGSFKGQIQQLVKQTKTLEKKYQDAYHISLNNVIAKTTGKDNYLTLIKNKRNQIETLAEDINIKAKLKKHYKETINRLNSTININKEKLSAYKVTQEKIKNNIEKQKNIFDKNQKLLVANYNLTFQRAIAMRDEKIVIDDELRAEYKKLRYKLAQIGEVDTSVIGDYEVEKVKYDEVKSDYYALTKAVNKLKKVIINIEKKINQDFLNFIKELNKILPEIFYVFFSSHNIKLLLRDEGDLFNSGIDLVLKIPGKQISNLSLLSGGEKSLLALILLFSILKIKKLPLVVLDEVEAALDALNTERFITYLKNFVQNTQFIIITHNLITMKSCGMLYGVTMVDEGVTKLVNVHLDQAVKLIKKNKNKNKKMDKF